MRRQSEADAMVDAAKKEAASRVAAADKARVAAEAARAAALARVVVLEAQVEGKQMVTATQPPATPEVVEVVTAEVREVVMGTPRKVVQAEVLPQLEVVEVEVTTEEDMAVAEARIACLSGQLERSEAELRLVWQKHDTLAADVSRTEHALSGALSANQSLAEELRVIKEEQAMIRAHQQEELARAMEAKEAAEAQAEAARAEAADAMGALGAAQHAQREMELEVEFIEEKMEAMAAERMGELVASHHSASAMSAFQSADDASPEGVAVSDEVDGGAVDGAATPAMLYVTATAAGLAVAAMASLISTRASAGSLFKK